MTRPSEHLTWRELACINRLGRPFAGTAPGSVVAEYPADWRATRLPPLVATFEDVRAAAGGRPIVIHSAYRPAGYNKAVGGVTDSQHQHGRALDVAHTVLAPADLFRLIRRLQRDGALPFLGGVGLYRTFVHLDVRPKTRGRLAVWYGPGVRPVSI